MRSFIIPTLAVLSPFAFAITPAAADEYDGPNLKVHVGVGRTVDGNATVGGTELSVQEATYIEGGLGLDFGRLEVGVQASHEAGGLNLAGAEFDASETDYMVVGDFVLIEDLAGGEFSFGAGYGLADADVGFALGSVEGEGGVYSVGVDYAYDIGNADLSFGVEYRESDLDFGAGPSVQYDRLLFGVKTTFG